MDKSSFNTPLSSVYQLKRKLDQSRKTRTFRKQKLSSAPLPHQDKKNRLSDLATQIKAAQQAPTGNVMTSKVSI